MEPTTTQREPSVAPPDAALEPGVGAVLADKALLWDTIWRASGEFVVVIDRAGIIRACNRLEDGFTLDDRFGLEGIRQRCRLLGGEPRISSAPGQGTTIDVTLPVPAIG